jgi:sterol desaturase/sphingolipid hydroxylase (fatty acid hydroxylase superfamily)
MDFAAATAAGAAGIAEDGTGADRIAGNALGAAGDGGAAPDGGARTPTPVSILGMSGLTPIVAVSSGFAAVYLVAATLLSGTPLTILAVALAGLFYWTFLEYLLHRWMLHWEPERPVYKMIRKCFPSHRSHHDHPMNERKNVKLQLKIIVGLLSFYTLVMWAAGLPLSWSLALNAGLLFGYQAYEYVHVACHHLPMRPWYPRLLKRHHAIHHHRDETVNFGVTTTIWDHVFRTTWRPGRSVAEPHPA